MLLAPARCALGRKAKPSAFGDGLFRAAWAASQQSESCGETAAFVGALVRLSERLAKVERTKGGNRSDCGPCYMP